MEFEFVFRLDSPNVIISVFVKNPFVLTNTNSNIVDPNKFHETGLNSK